jgi:hypothetical protein
MISITEVVVADNVWVDLPGANLNLFYYDNADRQVANIWLDEYSQIHQMEGQTQQSKLVRRYYPKTYVPGRLQMTARVRDFDQLNAFADFIRGHMKKMVNSQGESNVEKSLGLLNLHIEGEGMDVAGWVNAIQVRRERFVVAPQLQFDFTPINDYWSTNKTIQVSKAMKSWFSGSVIRSPYWGDAAIPGGK